ncbi:hypothetical protein D9613_011974 [Agrocybe pediades]|uniref:Retrotransposon gag domain-containing protein n=1 Tax=Agrocybe pediades TaxID=84607 RepID=A0A8H4VHV0_9AGAR|nr:hypothetical protein D9613_011974 [Agrocybe pediades]
MKGTHPRRMHPTRAVLRVGPGNLEPDCSQSLIDLDTSLPNQSTSTPRVSRDDENAAIRRAVYALGQNYQAYANQQRLETEHHRRTLQAIIDQLGSTAPVSLDPNSPSPIPHGSGVPRFHKPRVYDGSPTELDVFVREVTTALFLQRHSLPTDRDKSLYLSSYLADGSPTSWLTSIKKTQPHLFDNYAAFLDAFKKHFEDSDRYATALHTLCNLRQGSGSAATYASRFREHAWTLELTDQTKIQMFYDGLKETVKDAITLSSSINSAPSSFDAYVKLSFALSDPVISPEHSSPSSSSATSSSSPSVHSATPSPPSSPLPFDPLTPSPLVFQTLPSVPEPSPTVPTSLPPVSSSIDRPSAPSSSTSFDPNPEDNYAPMEIDATKKNKSH